MVEPLQKARRPPFEQATAQGVDTMQPPRWEGSRACSRRQGDTSDPKVATWTSSVRPSEKARPSTSEPADPTPEAGRPGAEDPLVRNSDLGGAPPNTACPPGRRALGPRRRVPRLDHQGGEAPRQREGR
jgi:hypothetical protein